MSAVLHILLRVIRQELIAFVIETPSVRAIVEHIGEPTRLPATCPARPWAALSRSAWVPIQTVHGLAVRCSIAAHPPAWESASLDLDCADDPLAVVRLDFLSLSFLPTLLSIESRVNAGDSLTKGDQVLLIDACEMANATLVLDNLPDTLALARRIIALCDTVTVRALMNDQRANSTRYRNHYQPTRQQQEVTP